MLYTMGQANILTKLAVNLAMDSLPDDGLYRHVFKHIFQSEIERDAVFVIIYQLSFFFKQATLLQNELLVESDRFDVLLQNGNQLQI